jgi:ferrous iron transport protein B
MKVALVGNPNTGKTSLFNKLTGLNQKVGNYPGITVDKKAGICKLPNGNKVEIIDLPGTYSLNASSRDEEIVTEALTSEDFPDYPDAVIVVVDATNLKRNLLLFTQVYDLGIPVILALNMVDLVERLGMKVDADGLSKKFGVPVIGINARKGKGVAELKEALTNDLKAGQERIFDVETIQPDFINEAQRILNIDSKYRTWIISNTPEYSYIDDDERSKLDALRKKHNIHPQRNKVKETVKRYQYIDDLVKNYFVKKEIRFWDITEMLDPIFTHKIWGFVIFFGLLTVIFQAIFSWSTWPMEVIETFFTDVSNWITRVLPEGPVAEMLADGVIPGIAGVLVFIPQITILFAFIALLEETGYMSRVVFLMDKVMRKFGLNGRSVVPLLSGMACAIPAVMATRSIENWKERLTTIMVTPLMTCSARLPVYTILIALVIPEKRYLGFINQQGLVLMALYLFGFVMALLAAVAFNKILKAKKKGYLIMEMPPYKLPQGRNVAITIIEKVKSFVFSAGKIIIAISMVLWLLARFGPADRKEQAVAQVLQQSVTENWDQEKIDRRLVAARLENSYIGVFGKAIEPAIEPLGYDWKIGIALISSFAAREVFVGTMATIYTVGDQNSELSVKAKMAADINSDTGKPRYSLAVAVSLLLFYALAMQCMSTLAVVYRETKGWKWPIIQFVYMSALAYIISLIAYQLLK